MEIQGSLFDDKEKEGVLERFMQEHFPYAQFKKWLFPKEIRKDYKAQAKIICDHLRLETVFEYRKNEIRCHISYAGGRPLSVNDDGRMEEEPFITVIPSIYDND